MSEELFLLFKRSKPVSLACHWRHIKNFWDIKVIENAEPMPDFLENF